MTKRQSRSEFIREAIYELCSDPALSKEVIYPQDRVGQAKGGRPKSAVPPKGRAALEKRQRDLKQQIEAAQKELDPIMERITTPEAQDAIMSIEEKSQRLKTLEQLQILKSDT